MNGPQFQTNIPNEDVTLYTGRLKFTVESISFEGAGVVKLTWLPKPLLRFELELGPTEQTLAWSGPGHLQLVDLGVEVERAAISMFHEAAGRPQLHGILLGGIPAFGQSEKLCSILFHVVGFWELWHQPLQFECGDWVATLNNVPNIPNGGGVAARLQLEGGFGITHWGCLRRRDGVNFGAEAAQEFLKHVGLLLSFARGAWCIPMLLVGVGPDLQVQWRSWTPTRSDQYRQTIGWYDEHMKGQLDAILPGLHAKMLDPIWKEAVELAIHWYVESSSGVQNVESSVVLSQVALERLACTHIVESRRGNRKCPKAKSIADQLRVLLTDTQIPTSVPIALHQAKSNAGTSSSLDGPATFVDMRNCIAHPRGALLTMPHPSRRAAKDLGLWYLELVLLFLFGYRGLYCNRLLDNSRGRTSEVVPWART
jgi:hypothetical protein